MSWENVNQEYLRKEFKFDNFITALDFVNKAGNICEEQDHHAEFILSWGSVVVKTWSHDVGGITERDTNLADSIDKVY
ncbi:MAG: 4a-hydroxytetrahydrobiopterin dehydratase [Candidatus Poseidoniaceae archaeon]